MEVSQVTGPADRERIEAIRARSERAKRDYDKADADGISAIDLFQSLLDIDALLSQLSALTEALTACHQERDELAAELALEIAEKAEVCEQRDADEAVLTEWETTCDKLLDRAEAAETALTACQQERDTAIAEKTRALIRGTVKGFAAGENADAKHWRKRAEQAEAALTACRAQGVEDERQRTEAENEIWEDVLRAVQRAWPEPRSYGDSPIELIAELIDERDGCRAQGEAMRELLRQEAGYYAYGDPERCTRHERVEYGGTHSWSCHKKAGHRGACSTHNDCGEVSTGGEVCGRPPNHPGLHTWDEKNAVQTFPFEADKSALTEALTAAQGELSIEQTVNEGVILSLKNDLIALTETLAITRDLCGAQSEALTACHQERETKTSETASPNLWWRLGQVIASLRRRELDEWVPSWRDIDDIVAAVNATEEAVEAVLTACRAQGEAIFREGYAIGYDGGLSDGHPLARARHYAPDDAWRFSDAAALSSTLKEQK
jgi:hypothetical protein